MSHDDGETTTDIMTTVDTTTEIMKTLTTLGTTTITSEEISNISYYNRTVDNNASVLVNKLKQFLEEQEILKSDNETIENPRQTRSRVVYINNKRVVLENDAYLSL